MFYKILAPVYQHVFPVETKDVFLSRCFKAESSLLDIGCSDGRVAAGLNQMNHGYKITAIDLSEELIEIAKTVNQYEKEHVEVLYLNMLDLSKQFNNETFDGVYCIGNTLVHLKDEVEIRSAIKSMYDVLKPEGVLVLQILNYDKILKEKPKTLPLIENSFVRFERNYEYEENHIVFSSKLVVNKQEQSASTVLYPISVDALVSLLDEVGFKRVSLYSGFDFSTYDVNKLPLVIVAHKDLTNK